jgi:hypothetical protein
MEMKRLFLLGLIVPLFTSYAQFINIPVYEDTVALKASKEAGVVMLKGYSGSTLTGGGFFIRIDSTYAEGTYAFDSKQAGQQWVRMGYPASYFLSTTTGTANVTTLKATTLGSVTTATDSTTSLILKDSGGKKWLLRVYTKGELVADSTGLN